MINIINKEHFFEFVKHYQLPVDVDLDFLYEIYEASALGIKDLSESSAIANINGINQYDLINYCIGEYTYVIAPIKPEERKAFLEKEDTLSNMASIVADKYLSLLMFNFQQKKVMNKFLPPVSTMNLYLNFMLNILNNYQKNEPYKTLITDLLQKSISISRCILLLLVDGYVTEAYATWRTLHECECTLVLLEKYGAPLIERYLRHMQYGIAYKNGLSSKEETDVIFKEIKENMLTHDLKSKDMKKYIEYGWLYALDEFKNDPTYKLNFKDGLEKISGINGYGESYNLSSEIVHATPMLIYSNKDYFYYITLLSLYEAFFRLERSFVNLFFSQVSKENREGYIQMRNLYYSHLMNIYNREKAIFISKNIRR